MKEITQDQFNALAEKIYLAKRENSPFSPHTQKMNALQDALIEAEDEHHTLYVDVYKVGYAHLETV